MAYITTPHLAGSRRSPTRHNLSSSKRARRTLFHEPQRPLFSPRKFRSTGHFLHHDDVAIAEIQDTNLNQGLPMYQDGDKMAPCRHVLIASGQYMQKFKVKEKIYVTTPPNGIKPGKSFAAHLIGQPHISPSPTAVPTDQLTAAEEHKTFEHVEKDKNDMPQSRAYELFRFGAKPHKHRLAIMVPMDLKYAQAKLDQKSADAFFHRVDSMLTASSSPMSLLMRGKIVHPMLKNSQLTRHMQNVEGIPDWIFDPAQTSSVLSEIEKKDPALAAHLSSSLETNIEPGLPSYQEISAAMYDALLQTLDKNTTRGDLHLLTIVEKYDGPSLYTIMKSETEVIRTSDVRLAALDKVNGVGEVIFELGYMLKYFSEVDQAITTMTNLGLEGGDLWQLQICSVIMTHLSGKHPVYKAEVALIRREVARGDVDLTLSMLREKFLTCERTNGLRSTGSYNTTDNTMNIREVRQAVMITEKSNQNSQHQQYVTQQQKIMHSLSQLESRMALLSHPLKRKRDRTKTTGPTARDLGGPYPAGSCPEHPFTTWHTGKTCDKLLARAANGWTKLNRCPRHPNGVHTGDQCLEIKNTAEAAEAGRAQTQRYKAAGLNRRGRRPRNYRDANNRNATVQFNDTKTNNTDTGE